MSEFTKVQVGKEVSNLEVSPEFTTYSGVEIIDEDGNAELVGSKIGRVISIPGISRPQAEAILADLTGSGFQYQPYTASDAHISPAAEIGDGVTINGVYSGIYRMSKNFGPGMIAQLEAPQDEEVDHEFPYESKQDRVYKREIADAKSQISVSLEKIEAEVFRATSAEESLSSAIQQTATEISANVLKKTGGSSSSFGWTLTDSSWELKSNNQTVFNATSSGVEISGKVTATSGTIGGFTISGSAIYNGTTSLSSGAEGVYVGTNGIRVNGSSASFRADRNGNVYLTGDLYIGGTKISAANLRSGAASAYGWANTKNSAGTTAVDRWNSAVTQSNKFANASKTGGSAVSTFLVTKLDADTVDTTNLKLAGTNVYWQTKTIAGVTIDYLGDYNG